MKEDSEPALESKSGTASELELTTKADLEWVSPPAPTFELKSELKVAREPVREVPVALDPE